MYLMKIPCYFCYTKLVYLKSAKLEQLIVYLICVEVAVKSN